MKKIISLLTILLLSMSLVNVSYAEEVSLETDLDYAAQINSEVNNASYAIQTNSEADVSNAEIPVYESTPPSSDGRTTQGVKQVGTIKFYVNDVTNVIYYEVVMSKGYKFGSFQGYFNITNLTSGLSSGRPAISGQKGSVSVVKKKNNVFHATVSGTLISSSGVSRTIPGGTAYLKWKCR